MIPRLVLVRHAAPDYDLELPARRWGLSEQGMADGRALVERLPPGALLVTSPEPKAWQTIDPDDRDHAYRDERFREVGAPDRVFADAADWVAARLAYLRGELTGDLADGWEPAREVVARFDEGLSNAETHAQGRPVVVATHGLAMTVWLTAKVALARPDEFWLALTMPDMWSVDLETGELRHLS